MEQARLSCRPARRLHSAACCPPTQTFQFVITAAASSRQPTVPGDSSVGSHVRTSAATQIKDGIFRYSINSAPLDSKRQSRILLTVLRWGYSDSGHSSSGLRRSSQHFCCHSSGGWKREQGVWAPSSTLGFREFPETCLG